MLLICRTKFCEGLVIGDKLYIYPILESLLKNFEEHKKRSYLSKFLTKVRIPSEFMHDPELSKLYAEVCETMPINRRSLTDKRRCDIF